MKIKFEKITNGVVIQEDGKREYTPYTNTAIDGFVEKIKEKYLGLIQDKGVTEITLEVKVSVIHRNNRNIATGL